MWLSQHDSPVITWWWVPGHKWRHIQLGWELNEVGYFPRSQRVLEPLQVKTDHNGQLLHCQPLSRLLQRKANSQASVLLKANISREQVSGKIWFTCTRVITCFNTPDMVLRIQLNFEGKNFTVYLGPEKPAKLIIIENFMLYGIYTNWPGSCGIYCIWSCAQFQDFQDEWTYEKFIYEYYSTTH